MILRIFAALTVFAALGCGAPRDGREAGGERPLPDTLTVAFYNVENLFDFSLDGTEYNEYKPGWFGWTEDVQRKKLASVAQVIAALGADIVGLCEIENKNALHELQRELDKIGAPYPYAAAADAPKSATVTALLSKYPIRDKTDYPVDRSRPILETLIAAGGDSLRVFVNHWPSKAHPESRRHKAAEILRRRLDELPKNADYVVIGDFNANHDEFATFHTAGFNDTKGRTGINHVLKTVMIVDGEGEAARRPERFVCKSELTSCEDCHYNLWMDLPEEKRMSYVYRGAAQTIDNMLMPRSMFDGGGFSYLDSSFNVFTLEGELMRDGAPYRWNMKFKGKQKYHSGHGYSDHLPVKASLVRASLIKDDSSRGGICPVIAPEFEIGDFEIAVDGWMSGDSRFVVDRCKINAKTGARSLRTIGMDENENRTAAKARLNAPPSKTALTMSVKGSGNLSIRLRRRDGSWTYYNAPDFKQSKSAKYKNWESDSWTYLNIPLPPPSLGDDDVYIELRAGKGVPFHVWIDNIRLK